MTFFYRLQKTTSENSQVVIENRAIQLNVDLIAMRKDKPQTYLYMFLAMTNIYGGAVDSIRFVYGDQELQMIDNAKSELALIHHIYREGYKRPDNVHFLRPDLLLMSKFMSDWSKNVALKAIIGDSHLIIDEPIQITKEQFESGEFNMADPVDAQQIFDEINALFEGRNDRFVS